MVSSPWLDVRVFYVRVSKCEIDDSTPEYLTVNHTPLHHDTLLEVNGIRTCVNSDRPSTLLRRDRLDKKSEAATFVSTDSIRITGSVKFEVFDKDVIILSGVLELCNSNGFTGESKNHGQKWSMSCELDMILGTSFLKVKQHMSTESLSPTVEIYVAGSFSGNPRRCSSTSVKSKQGKECCIWYRNMRMLGAKTMTVPQLLYSCQDTIITSQKMKTTTACTQEGNTWKVKMGNSRGSMLVLV